MQREMSFQEMPENREISFSLDGKNMTAFLVKGFFDFRARLSPYHRHHYTELHLLAEGEAIYHFSGQRAHVRSHEILLIPAGLFHEAIHFSPGARHIALQMVWPVLTVQKIPLPQEKTQLLFNEIEKYCRGGKSAGLEAALGMLFAAFAGAGDHTRPIRDTAFLIDDFFDHHYQQEARLDEISAILGLSTKQTARLVLRYTGRTFREEITHRRMEAARQLMKDQSLSLTEIAEKVGYQSYSGFWKAFHERRET